MFAEFVASAALFLASAAPSEPESPPLASSPDAWLATCADWDDWDKPAPAYNIFGNTYYVGTCGIAAILITGTDGHVLIDTGTQRGADIIADNIVSLGFALSDIRVILHSHEHFDHVGGLAKLQQRTGAEVIASVRAAEVLRSGQASRQDPQHGMHGAMDPVVVSGAVTSGDIVMGGGIALTAIETPGHTPGALSWTWRSCEGAVCMQLVYADSLSPVSADHYRFSDHPDYVADYRAGLTRLKDIDCDILLTPHPSASEMPARLAGKNGLWGLGLCETYAHLIKGRLDKRLAREAASE